METPFISIWYTASRVADPVHPHNGAIAAKRTTRPALDGRARALKWVTQSCRMPIFDPSQTNGSYFLSTTRSFMGMMALSVILMCSGQTSVQHLVMLHRPI